MYMDSSADKRKFILMLMQVQVQPATISAFLGTAVATLFLPLGAKNASGRSKAA